MVKCKRIEARQVGFLTFLTIFTLQRHHGRTALNELKMKKQNRVDAPLYKNMQPVFFNLSINRNDFQKFYNFYVYYWTVVGISYLVPYERNLSQRKKESVCNKI